MQIGFGDNGPDLRFQLQFPEGWKTANQTQAVLALSPKQDALVGLAPVAKLTPEQALQAFFQQQGIRPLPVVRAANTGISGVVDPLGRVIKELPLGVEGVVDSGLPQPIAPTLYVQWGDGIAYGLVAGAFLLGLARREMLTP